MDWSVPPAWGKEVGFVLAGGPSLESETVQRLSDRVVIATNSSYAVAPWATHFAFSDFRWYVTHKKRLQLLMDRVVAIANMLYVEEALHLWKRRYGEGEIRGLDLRPTHAWVRATIVTGAINILVNGGVRTVVLVGVDGGPDDAGRTHHHEPHAWIDQQHPDAYEWMREDFEAVQTHAEKLGVEIYNASMSSRFKMFERRPLECFL